MLDEVEKDVTVMKNTINTVDKVTLPPLPTDRLHRPEQILRVLSLPPTLLSFPTKSSVFTETLDRAITHIHMVLQATRTDPSQERCLGYITIRLHEVEYLKEFADD